MRLSATMEHYTQHNHGCILMLVRFEVYAEEGFWCGKALGVDIFTQGKTLDELMENTREAVGLHFEDEIRRGEVMRIQLISETEVDAVARN
jgi:predicted RNase H-like HicB family nuclease